MSDFTACVNAGAALLDAHRPGWFNDIYLDTLDLRYGYACVVGQVFSGYGKGLDSMNVAYEDAYEFGFTISDNASYMASPWDVLAAEWHNLIMERRRSSTATVVDWERQLLTPALEYTSGDLDDMRESALAQGRADGILFYQEALVKVSEASRIAGLSLGADDVMRMTNSLIDQEVIA